MASNAAAAAPSIWRRGEHEVSLARLHVLRAMYLVFATLGFFVHVPWLIDPDPARRGMLDSMLAGMWIISFFGVRYPLKLLPLFLFEFAWKTVWLVSFGLPQWMAGRVDPKLSEDIWMIGLGPIVFGLLIPWGYVWRHYVRAPAERWR